MVRPATHLGGSGLEYKPNKVPNFLDDLDKQYSEDERILKQQHNYLRERDQQMVRKAQGEEQLAKALLQLAPKAFSAMKNSRESKIDQGTQANLDKPDFPATEEDTKRQIEWFTKGEDELLKDQAALGEEVGKMPYMETRNKVMNMHGIEKIAYQRALQIRMLQLSTPQAFEDAMEGDTDYHNGLNQLTSPIEREIAQNVKYKNWLNSRVDGLGASKGAFYTSLQKEKERLVGTRSAQVQKGIHREIIKADRIKLYNETITSGDIHDTQAVVKMWQKWHTHAKATHGYQTIEGGKTANQQATEHVIRDLVDLRQAGLLTKDTVIKLIVGELANHPAGDNIPKSYWDSNGLIMNMLTKYGDQADAINLEERKTVLNQEAESVLYNENLTLNELTEFNNKNANNQLIKSETRKSLTDLQLNWTTPTQTTNLDNIFEGHRTSGKLLSKNVQDQIKHLGNPALKAKWTKISNQQKILFGDKSYTDLQKDREDKVTLNFRDTVIVGGGNETDNSKKVALDFSNVAKLDLAKAMKALENPDGTINFDPDFIANHEERMEKYWKDNGGGGSGKGCTGKYCINKFDGDYKNIITHNELVKQVNQEHRAKLTSTNRSLWSGDINKTKNAYLNKDNPKKESIKHVIQTVPEAFGSKSDMLGVLRNKSYSDEIIWKAKELGITPGEFVKSSLEAIVNDDTGAYKDFIDEHDLKNVVKNLQPDRTMLLLEVFKDDQNATYLLKNQTWEFLSPKKQTQLAEQAKERLEIRKQQIAVKDTAIKTAKAEKKAADDERQRIIQDKLDVIQKQKEDDEAERQGELLKKNIEGLWTP